MTIGDRFVAALVAKVYREDSAVNPDEVRAFAEGMRRAFYIADAMQVPEHRAGMCRNSERPCRRRAMLGTNTCEVHAAAFFGITPAEFVELGELYTKLTTPALEPDEVEPVEPERVDLVLPDGSRIEGELVSRHPQGDVVVADFSKRVPPTKEKP